MRRGMDYLAQWGIAAVASLQLLTRIPIPVMLPWNDKTGRRSVVFYPFAGAVIGALLFGAYHLLTAFLPPAPSAALLLVCWIWLTGALHLDGFMDTADGFGSNRPKERMLEIMKDPHVGAFGVVAGAGLMIAKFALLLALIEYARSGSVNVIAAVAAVPVLSRAFIPWAVVLWPYAGGSGGMGAALKATGVRHAAAATLVAALCGAALFASLGSGDAEFALPLLLGGAVMTAAVGTLAAWRMSRRLGGLTGDTYGALIEILELALLLALTAR
ncbi:adenosylcobinamide-GDP ribazoletransferase [Paenibacillus thermotolerans]|uniref:adenosylcobinamide-GDP ribazoletransferase n=1 Tax=Paenibacillus thermotolerans TaxID=3027807 RepID=UPI0023675D10|nr:MULTISPECIES: adenosylcobinamide-GDP ribazoletransferase [unclassified Paenibacillus]